MKWYLCWAEKLWDFPTAAIIFPARVLSRLLWDFRNLPVAFSSCDKTNNKHHEIISKTLSIHFKNSSHSYWPPTEKYSPLLFSSNDMTATQFNSRVPVNLVRLLGNKIIWYLVQVFEYLITYHRACPDIFQEPLINPWRISGLLWIPTTFKKENQVMHCQALQAI